MVGKRALRLATAGLLAVTAAGAQQFTGASTHQASAATNVVSITDWQFPAGCNTGFANEAVSVEGCTAETQDSVLLLDNKNNYQPDLASVIPTLQNGLVKVVNGNMVVTWKLKPNLKWSDGVPLGADDFIFNVPLNLAAGNTTGVDQIKSMKKIDAHTVQVTYKGLYAPYVAYGWPGYFFPKHYLERKYHSKSMSVIGQKFTTDAYSSPSDVFSGPYKIGSFTANQSVVLVRNPYYNALPAAAGHPRPAQIKFVVVSADEAVLAQDLQSNKAGVDAAENFTVADLPTLNAARNYHVHNLPGLFIEFLRINNSGVLKDMRLRQALEYSINKVVLYHNLYPQQSNPSGYVLHTMLPTVSNFVDPHLPISPYDPNRALQLLKSAGYSTGCTAPGAACYNAPGRHLLLRFAATQKPTRVKSFGIMARFWAAVGVHVTPRFGRASGNYGIYDSWSNNGILQHGYFDVLEMGFTESPDPQQNEPNYDPAQIPSPTNENGQNDSHILDRDQFAILQSAGHQLDTRQRLATFYRWERLINQRAYDIPLYNVGFISADNGTIGNYKPSLSQASNEWNAFQWYKTNF